MKYTGGTPKTQKNTEKKWTRFMNSYCDAPDDINTNRSAYSYIYKYMQCDY